MRVFLKNWHTLVLTLVAATSVARGDATSDVMVGYSATWRAGMGGTDQTKAAIYNQFAGANNIAVASGSPHRLNVIGTKESAHDPTNEVDCGAMIGWLRDYNVNIRDVADLGNALGADLFAYIGDMYNNGAAAQAEQPGRFSCYEQQWFWQNVVAHETGGHNFGLDHAAGHSNPTTIMLHNYCGGSQPFYSNPNIWLNGVRLLGDGSCIGYLAQGGDAAYALSTTAQGQADIAARTVWGSNLYPVVRRWQFNQAAAAAPAGTVITDSVNGAAATVRGQGASFTGTGLRLPGGTTGNTAANSIAAYLDLPNGTFSAMPNFTIEIWATPVAGSNWMRVIDIGRTVEAGDGLGAAGEYTGTPGSPAPGGTSASDAIELSAANNSTGLNNQRFIAGVDGTIQIADSALATTAGEMHHYAITFADTTASGAGGTVKWFRDGVLIKELNVAFDSASLEDVNVWLGRSLWSGDTMANIEYHDVRIIGAALADGQVAGNYRIGPHDAKSTLWANDAYNNSAFVNGAWEFGGTPLATRDYEVGTMLLRTPRNASNVSFPGKSLGITGGNFNMDATGTRTVTVGDLRMNGGATIGAYTSAGTQTLAGNITAKNFTDNTIRGNTGLVISANISGGVGGGGITYVENGTTLSGNNTGYLGATIIGDGRFSTLKISSETNLGGNPSFYGGAWLQLNRGILETTQTMTIDDANRGVLIGPSGGFLRPAAGTTLTIASTLNSPAAGNTLQTLPMDSNPIVGIFFVDGAGTVELTNPNNSHNAEMQVLNGTLRLSGNGRINNGDHWMPVKINGSFHDNSAMDQTLRGAISGTGTILKANTSTLHLNGSNPFSGALTVNGGTIYANPGNAANNRALSYASSITVNSGGTLRAGANGLFGWDGTQDKPITVNAGGTLTANGGLTSDVGVGTVTLSGGTLATVAGGATDWGSWRFDQATDKLLITADSTVSALNVKFGNADAAIEVAAGRTLNFTGTVTNTNNGGVSYLKKTGTGTLTLAGANTYTGATAITAGTLMVNGSLGNTPVTVAGGATLGGSGSIQGAATIQGVHRPGNNNTSPQTFGSSLTYDATSRLSWELGANSSAAGSFDKVSAAGALTLTAGAKLDVVLNAAGSTVALNDAFWSQPRSWTFLTGASVTGAFSLGTISTDPAGRVVGDYGSFSLQQAATSVTLVYTPNAVLTPHEQWLQANFGADWNNPAIAGDDVDGDSDGVPNLLERAFGGNPKQAEANLLPRFDAESPLLSIIYRRAIAAADLNLEVQESAGLDSLWLPASGSGLVIGNDGTVQSIRFTRPSGGSPSLFLRVRVTRP